MKKLLIIIFKIMIIFSLYAQSDESQVTIPKRIYVGDTVELRYVFYSAVDFFADTDDKASALDVDLTTIGFETETDDYTITKASFSRNELQYTFSMMFVPWRTGELQFPPLDIAAVVRADGTSSFFLNFLPVSVSSVLQNNSDTAIRASAGPLLLPGTMYALYAILLVSVILLILLIRLVARWRHLYDAYKKRKLLRAYVKNAKDLLRGLRKLERNGSRMDDGAFCAAFQHMIRKYLDFRIGYHFTTVSTSSIMETFDTIMAGTMSERKQSAIMSLVAVMRRTDYIRYARGSIDSERQPADQYAAKFGKDERLSLIHMMRDAVERFEG
ncbi:MAG: hypothetical protein J6I73_00020 [Treponema sp.]|nr:hypothetical protein [Treponema sp.]